MTSYALGRGGPEPGAELLTGVDLARDTVISGVVQVDGQPASGAYVRLFDAAGEFAAEVVTSAAGQFRVFAVPGTWTLRAFTGAGNGDATITAGYGITEVAVSIEV